MDFPDLNFAAVIATDIGKTMVAIDAAAAEIAPGRSPVRRPRTRPKPVVLIFTTSCSVTPGEQFLVKRRSLMLTAFAGQKTVSFRQIRGSCVGFNDRALACRIEIPVASTAAGVCMSLRR